MSPDDAPRRPRPGDPTGPKRPKTTEQDLGWKRPTEPDEPVRPKPRADRQPIAAMGGPKLVERVLFGRVGSTHLAQFCRQFATYSDAGVDLIKSLDALQKQFARTALGPILGRLILGVRQGETLGDAMAREPEAFDTLFLSMIRVAEARGGVPETMRGMADHYDARVRLIRQARSAMIYPIIVLVVASAVVALVTIVLLPMFASLLTDLAGRSGGEGGLPLPSRVLMGFSHFVTAVGWWLMPVVAIGVIVGGIWAYGTKTGKAAFDEIGLSLPVLGKFLRLLETTRFSRTLSALLAAGVDMKSSLDLTSGVMRLTPYRRAIDGLKEDVMAGEELSEGLAASRRFSADVVAIVNSGEETGRLPESLEKLADDYEEQVTYMVKNLASFIQPLIMIFLGGVVLFIILAIFLPYVAAISSLAR